jgi:hypothetical protein
MTNITTFKELGTFQYWENNNMEIWSNISIRFGLKYKIEAQFINLILFKKYIKISSTTCFRQ